MAQVRRSNVGPISRLLTFDVRNGEVSSAVSLLTKSAIPEAYRWVPVQGVPTTKALENADLYIKSALHQLNSNRPAELSNVQARKVAIILGTVRAALTELYRLTRDDLIPGETVDPVLTYTAPANENAQPTIGIVAEVPEEGRNVLLDDLNITDRERGVISDLVMCAVGIPAVHGASLMATGHHYLSDVKEKSRALYLVMENQFWRKDPTKTWCTEDGDIVKDALWHKAGHPVSMTIKFRMAVDPNVAEKIRRAGSGSAASRLPARESVLKAAETARTLMVNVRPFFEAYGGSLDLELLSHAIEITSAYIPTGLSQAAAAQGLVLPGYDMDRMRDERTPPSVTNRETALKWLEDLLKRNADTVAICFGFFEAVSEATLMSGSNTESQTLLGSNSLMKYKSQAFAAYAMGRDAYGDYKALKAKQRSEGTYAPIKIGIL